MLEWAILLVLAIAGAHTLHASAVTARIDNQILDHAAAFMRPAPRADIILVTIDDASIKRTGAWPWPRAVHAKLVERLSAAGARLIVFDVLLLDPTDQAGDAALARAIRDSGRVVLPHTFGPRANSQNAIDPVLPLPEFARAARALGHVVVESDPDGVLRRFDLDYRVEGKSYPHLGVSAMAALGQPVAPGRIASAPIVPFQPNAAFAQESASNVLSGASLDGFLRDKIVIVGATAAGLGDRFSVASGDVGLMPGIETQANLINALLTDTLIEPVAAPWHDAVAAAALLVLFLAFWHLSPRAVLVCAVGLIAALLAVSVGLLAGARVWLAPAAVIVVIMLAYPLWNWRRLSHASRFLDREAARLTGSTHLPAAQSGLDYVTSRIEQLRAIIRTVHDALSFLRQVIEAAPDAIIVLDRDETVRMLNRKATRLFANAATLDQASLSEFLICANARLVRDGLELETADGRAFLIARADLGEVDRADTQGSGQRGEAGSIIALRDVTELRRLDDERRQMLEFLSHDMRSPQVAIVGLTRRVLGSPGDAPPDAIRRIRLQAERTLKLADDFVQLARLEQPDLTLEDSDIGALVAEACDRAWTQADSKAIAIEQEVPEDPLFAAVDASLIARMLDNLIGNAIKYSGERGQVAVVLRARVADGFVLSVADRGPGLPKARLADPFARFGAHGSATGADAGPSAGLGLALVKKVVDAHHGTIDVQSAAGEGTTFTISIPGVSAALAGAQPPVG
jgi:CHASE2 domain-containing sensor protein/signal transduction histidine kinase